MRDDYLITIFSRNKGKTRTFSLDRRLVYVVLGSLIFLLLSCILFGQAYFQEHAQRQRSEGRSALLEQLMSKLEERTERQGGEAPTEVKAENEVQRPAINVAARREENEATAELPESGSPSSEGMKRDTLSVEPIAKTDDAKATPLEGDREGFRLDFKLVNLIGEPISGNIAIIAALRSPHNPRFVSFPSMKLVDGMPVVLRKSVSFDIRYYRYITGKFYFPFAYAESFRILVYNPDEELILNSTLPAEEVALPEILSEERASTRDSP
jgi:hypothetical protein